MKRRTLLGGLAAAGITVPAATAAGVSWAESADDFQIAITEQVNNQILVFNRGDEMTDDNVLWSFTPGTDNGWIDMMEVRFRATERYGPVAMTAGGTGDGDGRVGILKYDPTNKQHTNLDDLLWHDNPGTYPHSVERIPHSMALVVGGSRYGLHVYAPKNSDLETLKKVQEIPFSKAHNTLWDNTHNILWAAGELELRTYEVEGSGYDLRLKQVGDTIELPYNGHDVQPSYSNPDVITVTDSDGVYEINRETREMTTISETRKIKSYTQLANGEAMWTTEDDEDGGDRPWAGPRVYFTKDGETTEHIREGAEIYKARLVTNEWV